jgi:hypothetical protein
VDRLEFLTEEAGVLFQLLVGGVILTLLAHFLWPRSDFTIRVRGGSVGCSGKLPAAQKDAISTFLLDDLRVRNPVKIMGSWQAGRLHLWFHGPLTTDQKQRVRNFLLTRL